MGVWSILIFVAAAWLGLHTLTALMAQHHRELVDAWEVEHAHTAGDQKTKPKSVADGRQGLRADPTVPPPAPRSPDPDESKPPA